MAAPQRVEIELDYDPELAENELPWLTESPFGAVLELAVHAANEVRPGARLEELRFTEPLRWSGPRRCVIAADPGTGTVRVTSTGPADDGALEHLAARIAERTETSLDAPEHRVSPARVGAHAPCQSPLDHRSFELIDVRVQTLIDAALGRGAARCFDSIEVSDAGWIAWLSSEAPWDGHYAVHPAVLQEVWYLASAFWAAKGLAGARPLLAHSLQINEGGARITSIELRETAPLQLRFLLHTARGVACVLDGVTSDTALAVEHEAPAIRALAQRDLRAELGAVPISAQASLLETIILETVGETVRRPAQDLAVDATFRELGLKSLDATRIAFALGHGLGVSLSSTLLFDHPTIAQLARHLSSFQREGVAVARAAPRARRLAPAARAPIAIVGMGCRMPGGIDDARSYWSFLSEGGHAVGPVSAGRAALLPGFRGATWSIATLEGIEQFDARFFDMGASEAITTSPQQRLLLEVTWEALENAGIVPSTLNGSATSVYVAGSLPEYASVLESRDAYFVTGNAPSALAGRISYTFGLEGASVAIDTACSSAAVALCMACDDLRAGSSDLAIAGGANLILDPRVLDGLAAASVLSEQGRCAAFDESADGYVRGEACCVVVLRRLDEAVRRGERVLGVVREYGIGHGGRSAGLAAPRREALVSLIHDVLHRAAIDPKEVGYVEAHGTGTRVGDAIELEVLAQTYGAASQREAPVWVGSAKTNIGHTESAAGLVGVIKAALALSHGNIPAHLHFENPSASFDWVRGGLAVCSVAQAWPATERPRLAAVNSFGISGTYAHVILEEPPSVLAASEPVAVPQNGLVVIPLSARTPSSLRAMARAYAGYLHTTGALGSLAKTAWLQRELFALRAAIVADSAESAERQLEALAQREPVAPPRKSIVAFLFPGQGVQAAGVGRELYESHAVFRETFDECAQLARTIGGLRLHDLLEANATDGALSTDLAQPLIFSIELAMTRLLHSWGIVPDFVLGHSLGEYVAACVAGAFDVADAMRLVVERGRLMRALSPRGAMLAIEASPEVLASLMGELTDPLDLASINAPDHNTLAGTPSAIDACLDQAARRGLKAHRLRVDQAFHSRLMDPVLDAFERVVAQVEVQEVSGKLISNVSGGLAGPELRDPGYFRDHIRKPVRFMQGIRTLVEHGANVFLEVGPRSALIAPAARATDAECYWLPTLFAKAGAAESESVQMLAAAARMFELGVQVNVQALVDAQPVVRAASFDDIPFYAFDRKRFWPSGAELQPSARAQTPSVEYELTWQSRPTPETDPARAASLQFVIAGRPESAAAQALVEALVQRGAGRVIRASLESPDVHASASDEQRVVLVLEPRREAREVDAVIETCALAAAWARTASTVVETKVAYVTLGGQQTVAEPRDAHGSALASFARAVGVERPACWQGLFDLPASPRSRDASALAASLLAADGEDECAIRCGQRFVGRLAPATEHQVRDAFTVRADGVYCITGGFGHIGFLVARWLVQRGARELCLIARGSSEQAARMRVLETFRSQGVTVSHVSADVADPCALRTALECLERPIAAVFHAAGVPGDTLLADLDETAIGRVVRGKAEGARVLCEMADELGIQHVVLFSSLASVLAGAGQTAYAAANGYLNALASIWRGRGQRVQSVLWGPWADGGMGETVGSRAWAAGGFAPMKPSVGLAALERILSAGSDQRIVVDVDWGALRALFELSRPCVIFGELGVASETSGQSADLAGRLLRLTGDERVRALQVFLSAEIASVAGDREIWHEPDADIFEVGGLGSLAVVQLRGRIRASLGLNIDNALVIEHRSVRSLSVVLDELLRKRWSQAG